MPGIFSAANDFPRAPRRFLPRVRRAALGVAVVFAGLSGPLSGAENGEPAPGGAKPGAEAVARLSGFVQALSVGSAAEAAGLEKAGDLLRREYPVMALGPYRRALALLEDGSAGVGRLCAKILACHISDGDYAAGDGFVKSVQAREDAFDAGDRRRWAVARGILYDRMRDADALWGALTAFPAEPPTRVGRIELRFARLLGRHCRYYGQMPEQESLAHMEAVLAEKRLPAWLKWFGLFGAPAGADHGPAMRAAFAGTEIPGEFKPVLGYMLLGRHFGKKDWAALYEVFDRVVPADGRKPEMLGDDEFHAAVMMRASALFSEGKFNAAVAEGLSGLRRLPVSWQPQMLFLLADISRTRGDFADAEMIMNHIVASRTADPKSKEIAQGWLDDMR